MKLVLLVEDDDETRDVLGDLLQEAGYGVLRAEDGAVAWKLLQERPDKPDIILLDLMMPIMNGWDFRRKQRLDPRLSAIPILVMSAGGQIASVAADLGAVDHIEKPVEIDDLLGKLERLCP